MTDNLNTNLYLQEIAELLDKLDRIFECFSKGDRYEGEPETMTFQAYYQARLTADEKKMLAWWAKRPIPDPFS